ncbi:MAG TPA: RES family NAD+ phosphorylase [Longimicrobium sp.]|nr:RES family NAD+ phosphorylase [Longimicrobium sp.]
MRVWRIARAAYQALDGEGARLYGGRWNPEGVAAVYASASLALAALEYLVHVDTENVPGDLVALEIEVPDDAGARVVLPAELPADWNRVDDHPACVETGAGWAREAADLVLRVPSAIVPEESNFLINPSHPAAGRVSIVRTRPFSFDPRLLG